MKNPFTIFGLLLGLLSSHSVVYTQSIKKHPAPTLSFEISKFCHGETIIVENNSTGGGIYQWDIVNENGDTINSSEEEKPSFPPMQIGDYSIHLSANNGHESSLSKSFRIDTLPQSRFTWNKLCLDDTVTFTANSECSTRLKWQIDNLEGSLLAKGTGVNLNYQFSKSDSFDITLTSSNSFGKNTITKRLFIHAIPIANFQTSDLCVNDTMTFFNTSICGNDFVWDFGNPASGGSNYSTEREAKHLFTDLGTYTVTLRAINDRGVTDYSKKIEVDQLRPVADFTYVTNGLTVSFTNESIKAKNYYWDFGNQNSTSQENPTYTFETGDIHKVTLVAQTSCFYDQKSIFIDLTGIAVNELGNIAKVYPNPTVNLLKIETIQSIELIEVRDMLGRKQQLPISRSSTAWQINTEKLATGVYVLILKSEGISYQSKVVKN